MTNAKKHLGQHFLTSKKALRDMLGAGRVQKGATVLEIGPGKGVLTRGLLETGARVVAIETDADMVTILQDTFAPEIANGMLTLVHNDVLNIPLTKESLCAQPFAISGDYKVVANIPYYITGELIRRFLTAQHQPTDVVFLIQKEVAERIAKSKKETVLSLSVKAYGTPHYVASVPARYFTPSPKVDSAIIAISAISRSFFDDLPEDRFFKIVKKGFASKRKTLMNNLSAFGSKPVLAETFNAIGIPHSARAEDVGLLEWKQLATALESHSS